MVFVERKSDRTIWTPSSDPASMGEGLAIGGLWLFKRIMPKKSIFGYKWISIGETWKTQDHRHFRIVDKKKALEIALGPQ